MPGDERACRVEMDDALHVIKQSLDSICVEHLILDLAWIAKHLAPHTEMEAGEPLLTQLGRSVSRQWGVG